MSDSLELHPVFVEDDCGGGLEIILLGDTIHPHTWVEDQKWGPSFRRVPSFPGFQRKFDGGPYEDITSWGPVIENLEPLIPSVQHLLTLTMRQDRIKVSFANMVVGDEHSTQGAYEVFGPNLLESIAEAISEAKSRNVSIVSYDPHVFELADLKLDLAIRERRGDFASIDSVIDFLDKNQ